LNNLIAAYVNPIKGRNSIHKSSQTSKRTQIVSSNQYEQDLLIAAQEGDIEAYEDLQRLLEPDIRRFVQRKIFDAYAVDDVLQDVFLAFYQNLSRIQPVENLRPYIFRIARNKAYDDLRKLERNSDVSLDDEPVQMRVSFTEAQHQPKPDDLSHWMLLHIEVQAAIEQLPDNQREALLLYSEEQMSYAEIADVMDCSIGTVKSRLFYAKKALRGLMKMETLAVLDEEFGNAPVKKTKVTGTDPEKAEETYERA
jgi:RNA polymerase sigma-70 factor, ECF subfamily